MNVKQLLKECLYRYNPLAICRRNKMRKRLSNRTPSLLCPNCLGGILFHDLGLQFRSPTVNLMLTQTDFVKFVLNIDYYLSQELLFFEAVDFACPCAKLGDIVIHFTHYTSPDEAKKKWDERKTRINWDNLFIVAMERDGLTEEDIKKLGNLRCRGIVVFTAKNYPNIPYALHVSKYSKVGELGNILTKSWWNEGREYETFFDFVKWFNEADGQNFDIRPYAKK